MSDGPEDVPVPHPQLRPLASTAAAVAPAVEHAACWPSGLREETPSTAWRHDEGGTTNRP